MEPSRAKEMVNPIGRNMMPSTPVSVNMGRKTRMMMAIAKNSGRPTSCPAARIPVTLSSHWTLRWRWIFSTRMMAASAIKPIAIASPPNEIRSAARLKRCIRINAKRIEKGRESTTIIADGKIPHEQEQHDDDEYNSEQ